jgi:hypothetical protein
MTQRRILLEMYEFSPQESKLAQILPEINLQYIKTQLAFSIKEKDNLKVDPNNYAAFVQAEAEIRGAIGAYQFLIDCHDNTVATVAKVSD